MGQGMVYKGHLIHICTPQSNSNLNTPSIVCMGEAARMISIFWDIDEYPFNWLSFSGLSKGTKSGVLYKSYSL